MCLAIPGRIKSIALDKGLVKTAKVVFGSIVKDACLDMVPHAKEGDYVLVHAGVAINLVDRGEAQRTFEYLERYGGLEDLLPEQQL